MEEIDRKPMHYWNNKERVIAEAKKHLSRSEFAVNSKGAYGSSIRNGWFKEACSHMELRGSIEKRWIYKAEFEDGSVYIGLTCDFKQRSRVHLVDRKSAVCQYMAKTNTKPVFKIISDLLAKKKASELEAKLISDYRNNGINVLNRHIGGGLGSDKIIYTFQMCKETAYKYKTRSEFVLNSRNEYLASWRNKWLDKICTHMPNRNIKRPNRVKHTFEKCKEEAKKYSYRTEYAQNNKASYGAAARNKWLNDICNHMIDIKLPHGSLTYDKCKENAALCLTITEFNSRFQTSYNKSREKFWIKDFFPNTKIKCNLL